MTVKEGRLGTPPFFERLGETLFLVALTGGIASGKSTVCELFQQKGAYIIDSDLLAREAVRKGRPAWREIVEHFGDEILQPDGEIDRPRLAEKIFNNPDERAFLNGVTHPRVFQLMAERLKQVEEEAGEGAIVVMDIPLLIEADAVNAFDFTLVVDAPREVQVERLQRDRGSTHEEALARINSQVSREKRSTAADLIIENAGNKEDLMREVDRAWNIIRERADQGESGD